MATKAASTATTDDEYEQMFPNWVYQVPGLLLILAGFGGIVFLTFF